MRIFEWVVVIGLPTLIVEHTFFNLWALKRLRRNKSNDESWQKIFKSIDESYMATGKILLKTWEEMQRKEK